MKNNALLSVFCLLVLPALLPAQDAASLALQADELLQAGKAGEAAARYEQAARLDADNAALLYKAAEAYYRVRDYQKAVICYTEAKSEYERYELAGLRYARALKQCGRYDEAADAFRTFGQGYKGSRKAQIINVVSNEIKGCELASEFQLQAVSSVLPAEVKILPQGVNSPDNEFAPMVFADNLLYYSTLQGGQVRFMRAQRKSGLWQSPAPAAGLPVSVSARFGSGTFSPDGKRFYCTQCDPPAAEERGGNGLRTRCSIYLLRRTEEGSWSDPVRLRDYINTPDRTATHPFVTEDRGNELLFFASDRDGGSGGLDIYVCERPLDSDDLDFSMPRNLGNTINTAGDEVTPFFEPGSQTLWFSSNSQVSVGGLDVFKSVRAGGKWSKPENAGFPVNSPADDFYFSQKRSGGGFFVSNRSFGAKTGTRDEDIFEFMPKDPPVALTGHVLEQQTHQALGNCMVSLYELDADDTPHLLEVHPSTDGAFRFSLLQQRRYRIEAARQGYETTSLPVGPDDTELTILLSPRTTPASASTGDSTLGLADLAPATPARKTGVYRVHLEIQSDFNAQAPRYGAARAFGEVIAEPLPEQGIVRVLLGEFQDAKTANEVAAALRIEGTFPQAFVVKD